MKRIVIAVALAVVPGTITAQEEPVKSPSEVNAAMLADLRGFNEGPYPGLPATFQPLPFSPFTLWTTGRLSRPSHGGETVSVASLSHRVPTAAQKAYERGTKLSNKGDDLKAAEEFEKAVALDPEYAAAHGDLGVQYIRLGRLKDAEAELRRAIALDPYVSIAHSNLGWVLFQSRNSPEAEQSAAALHDSQIGQ